MSILVNLDQITDQQWQLIRKELWIKLKTSFFLRQKFGSESDSKPIILYQKHDTQIALPFVYANCLMNKFMVDAGQFPRLSYDFTSTLREKQVSVSEEAVVQLNTYHTTTLWLPCGFGKTVISAYLSARIKRRTIVTFKNTILKKQWRETFENFTNASIWTVGEESCPDTIPDVILCMVLQIRKIPIHWLDDIGTLVLDEAHELCTHVYSQAVMLVSPCYIIACTATPIRENGAHKVLYAICGTHNVYRVPDVDLTVYKLNTEIKFTMKPNKRGDPDWSGLCKEIAECDVRNTMIRQLVHMFWKRKIVILTIRAGHAIFLEELMKDTESIESMTGSKKSYRACRILTGTFSKIGTAFDEATLCDFFDGMRIDMLIMVGSTKSKTRIVQALGRAERSDRPIVIDLTDNNSTGTRHWNVRRAIYNKRKANIKHVTMSSILDYSDGPRPIPKVEFVIVE